MYPKDESGNLSGSEVIYMIPEVIYEMFHISGSVSAVCIFKISLSGFEKSNLNQLKTQ